MNKTLTKRIVKIAGRMVLSGLLFLSSTQALSAIPYRNAFESVDLINQQTKELNLGLLAKIQAIVDQNQFNMANYIPLNGLPTNDDGTVIGRRILRQTMKTMMESDSSALAQQAQAVNDAMSTSIDRNGHSFSFRVNALEGGAQIAYKGIVTAALSYNGADNEAKFEVSQVVDHKTVAFTHTTNSTESINSVGIRWSF